jgi:Cu/Ag efflux protein CusF
MKTNPLHASGLLAIGALLLAGTGRTLADDTAAAGAKSASGTVATVNVQDKVLSVRGFIFSRSYVLGDHCTLTVTDRKAASLADFRPGEKVDITYRNVDGVLIASSVAEVRLAFTGTVSAFDPAQHTLTLQHEHATKTLKVADNCGVILNANAAGGFNDIKLGNRVTVVYETPNGQWTARRIEQPSLQFTGTLEAINAADRTLTAAKKLIGGKEFHLATDCAIVHHGAINGRLQDLKLGQSYELSYTTVNGVNIVSRIAPAPAPETIGTPGQNANSNPPL